VLKNTQLEFWAVNMGKPPEYDPLAETEYLLKSDLRAAEMDDTLKWIVSTYDAHRDRLVLGADVDGPRVLNFGPLLEMRDLAFNHVVEALLDSCERPLVPRSSSNSRRRATRRGAGASRLLQVPWWCPKRVSVRRGVHSANLLLASDRVMGTASMIRSGM
jgi:hypothetical protein